MSNVTSTDYVSTGSSIAKDALDAELDHTAAKENLRKEKRDFAKERVLQSLENLLNCIICSSSSSFASERISVIKIEPFDPMQTPPPDCFFQPWSASQLDEYPVRFDDPVYLQQRKTSLFVLDQAKHTNFPATLAIFGDPAQYPKFNCSRLINELFLLRNTELNSQSLLSSTEWTHKEGQPFAETLNKQSWACGDYLTHTRSEPHIKLLLSDTDGVHDGSLLNRGEALAILGVMIERLQADTFMEYLIIPVMLFSFIGQEYGRILIAHFDGTDLSVRISPAYSFEQTSPPALALFVRYAIADAVRSEDTKELPPLQHNKTLDSTQCRQDIPTLYD